LSQVLINAVTGMVGIGRVPKTRTRHHPQDVDSARREQAVGRVPNTTDCGSRPLGVWRGEVAKTDDTSLRHVD